MIISIATSRTSRKLMQKNMLWSELCQRLANTKRTKETLKEFLAMSSEEQTKIKDVGGFVAGSLSEGIRRRSMVNERCCVTLDLDNGTPGICEKLVLENKYTCCIYSTHKHTPEKPRLRLVYLLKYAVNSKAYMTIAKGLAEEIGEEFFDPSTYEPERLMFFPSTSKDGEFFYKCLEGELVNPEVYIKRAEEVAAKELVAKQLAGKELTQGEKLRADEIGVEVYLKELKAQQQDPLTKKGIVGAFCRTYSVTEALDKFLRTEYEVTADPKRYKYIHGTGGPGVVVYDEGRFVYSFHSSDKLSYKLMNAFDLVRRAKFGDNEDRSFKAMERFALADEVVKARYDKEQQEEKRTKGAELLTGQLQALVDDLPVEQYNWLKELEYSKDGELLNTLNNQVVILQKDPQLQSIAYNEQFDAVWIKGDVPWPKVREGFAETDFAGLKHYFSKYYKLECGDKLYEAVQRVATERVFNPIKDYFAELTWDGVSRIPTLLVDYLGADNTEYTRQVTIKTLVGAVARVYEPGVKFEYVLILNGPQGCGKSTLWQKLGRNWFSDNLSLTDMKDKTAAEKVGRYWIIEMAELEGLNKASWDTIKAFVSRQDDTYRDVYARTVTSHKRRCILVGTTNDDVYLKDITGNRRFWPVKCSGVSRNKAWSLNEEIIGQIWAEALTLYKQGVNLWLEGDVEQTAKEVQAEAMVYDERADLLKQYLDMYVNPYEWEEMNLKERWRYIDEWMSKGLPEDVSELSRRSVICNSEIIAEFFRKDPKEANREEKKLIKDIITMLPDWELSDKRRYFKGYGQQRCYRRK